MANQNRATKTGARPTLFPLAALAALLLTTAISAPAQGKNDAALAAVAQGAQVPAGAPVARLRHAVGRRVGRVARPAAIELEAREMPAHGAVLECHHAIGNAGIDQ